MRLIDGDALMAELKRAMRSWMEDDDFEKGVRTGITRGINGAMHAPIIGGWIPCSERLPEEEGWYLVTIQNDKTRKRRTENDLFAIGIAEAHKHTPYKFCKDGHRQTVIAWMPLPEPYEAS